MQNFVDHVSLICAGWLNQVDRTVSQALLNANTPQEAIDAIQAAYRVHGHAIADVAGLQAALDALLTKLEAAQTYELKGYAAALDAAHLAASDPHPVYLTQAEGDARYCPVSGGCGAPPSRDWVPWIPPDPRVPFVEQPNGTFAWSGYYGGCDDCGAAMEPGPGFSQPTGSITIRCVFEIFCAATSNNTEIGIITNQRSIYWYYHSPGGWTTSASGALSLPPGVYEIQLPLTLGTGEILQKMNFNTRASLAGCISSSDRPITIGKIKIL